MWETACASLEIVEVVSALFVSDLVKRKGRTVF